MFSRMGWLTVNTTSHTKCPNLDLTLLDNPIFFSGTISTLPERRTRRIFFRTAISFYGI